MINPATRSGPPAGVVLAAGRSRRMGRPKPLLVTDGETFLARAVRVLREGGCAEVVVVVPEGAADVRAAAAATGAAVVANPAAGSEQVDSLRLALVRLGGAGAAVVLPVDVPGVRAATVRALVAAWEGGAGWLVVPRHEGMDGHPVVVDRALFGAVRFADLAEGMRSILAANADRLYHVDVADAGALVDMDTPADLARHGLGG